jgi:hypothetical protein
MGYKNRSSKQQKGVLFNFLKFYRFYIYLHVHTLFGPHTPLSHPPTCTHNLIRPLILQFCWRENIGDNKDIAFLLAWDKDSSTERFLVLLACTCVLWPIFVLLYQTPSLVPSSLPIVALASLRLFYSLLYSEHINHIQVLGFLPLPYPSHAHSLPLVCVTHVR